MNENINVLLRNYFYKKNSLKIISDNLYYDVLIIYFHKLWIIKLNTPAFLMKKLLPGRSSKHHC